MIVGTWNTRSCQHARQYVNDDDDIQNSSDKPCRYLAGVIITVDKIHRISVRVSCFQETGNDIRKKI